MPRGRLIKSTNQDLLNTVQVEAYPWQDLSPETILLPDNPRKSVVLAKSHPTQELKSKVQKPAEFGRTFGQVAKPILPQDMTAEYLASQEELRQRKRRMQMDEDEVVALELLDLNDEHAEGEDKKSSEEQDADSTGQENSGAAASSAPSPRAGGSDIISDLSSLTSHKGMGLGTRGLDFSMNEITQEKLDAEVAAAYERGLAQGRHDVAQSQEQMLSAADEAAQLASNAAQAAEVFAAERKQIEEQSYSEGVLAGRAQGHAEGLQEAEQKYSHSMELFTKALSELQHLKGELLSTGRDIFAEIAQMCAERVLRKHVQWNDEALRNVFIAAMSQFQAQDELKIEMHPEDIARLEQQIPADQRTRLRLVSNTKLVRGDIKIEANNEVVSFDIEKTVESVIDSLKDELFEAAKTDESTEKAG